MSDKNRVITNGLFRKKMAELLGEDIVNTPQFNDFQALDVTTFTREVDKLIDNPPWSGGGSGGDSDVEVIIFEGTESQGVVTITCEKTPYEIEAIDKPISAFLTIDGSSLMPMERPMATQFTLEVLMDNPAQIAQVVVYGSSNTWVCGQNIIPLGGESDDSIVYKADVSFSLDGGGDPTFTVTSLTYDDPDNGPTAVSLSKALADANIHVDDSFPYYTLPTQGNIGNVVIDFQVNDTFDGSTIPHMANASGILRFSAADGITKTVNYSGAIGMPDPGVPGKINTVVMTITIGDDNGTPTYSFIQTDV